MKKDQSMSVQDSSSLPHVRPKGDDRAAWHDYWQHLGQPWRTEPEIDEERQQYLAERQAITLDTEKGIFPFKDIKLSRADVEWLLARHENGRGPVDWGDASQWERKGVDLRGANLEGASLEGLNFTRGHLEEINLREASLQSAKLIRARLEGAVLADANLEGADLRGAHLEEVHLLRACVAGANLQRVFFNIVTNLDRTAFTNAKGESALLAGVHWNGVDLSMVDWSMVKVLGDESKARQQKKPEGSAKSKDEHLQEYEKAVRANRRLATELQSQGLNEDAACFAYRAQKLQRGVMRFQHKYIQYLFSLLLDLLAGYGYRPIRTLLWYVLVVGGFATAYAFSGHLPALPDALVYSLTSFHGRGFFPGLGSETTLHNTLVVLAAAEAVIGLFIEISFIATFTQRYFGK